MVRKATRSRSGGTAHQEFAPYDFANGFPFPSLWSPARTAPDSAPLYTPPEVAAAEAGGGAIGHVGDSRAYRLRGGKFERLTRDHSLVEEMRRKGQLTDAQAEDHPQRSIITRALGPEPEVKVDVQTVPAQAGDVFLICSDGLTTMLDDEHIARLQIAGVAGVRDHPGPSAVGARATRYTVQHVTDRHRRHVARAFAVVVVQPRHPPVLADVRPLQRGQPRPARVPTVGPRAATRPAASV